jgi:bifunctional non-homologous end joining protein LigD
MHVEDHPIEYGTFEGVIPEGYGAGIVSLWDQGTWTPQVDDVDGALKKGDLKFTLDGYKLKGSWVLVRTGGKWAGAGTKSWLLIKHKDDWAGDLDITEFAPQSVKSGGDFADILAAENPDIWVSHRPAKGGETGAMLDAIIKKAAALKVGRRDETPASAAKPVATKAPAKGAPAKQARKPAPPKATAKKPKPKKRGS